MLLGILLISSKGAAAVTGGGFIVLAGTLSSVGKIPPESIAVIFGIDRFMSEARALTNLVGNGVATIFISKMTGNLDSEKLRRELNGHKAELEMDDDVAETEMAASKADV